MKNEGLFIIQFNDNKSGDQKPKVLEDINLPETLNDTFANIDEIVEKLPHKKQAYYTVGKVRLGDKKRSDREGISQCALLWDIDLVIQDKKEEYIKVFCDTLGLDRNKTGVIDSGYGLQFIVAFKDDAYKADFEQHRPLFKKQSKLLALAMEAKNLIGEFEVWNEKEYQFKKDFTHVDESVFRLCSLARLPGTINDAPKKKREARPTKLINGKIAPQFDSLFAHLSFNLNVSEIKEVEHIIQSRSIDYAYVRENCGYLQWGLKNPEKIHEDKFFSLIGLLKHTYENEEEGIQACLDWLHLIQKHSPSATLINMSDGIAREKIERAYPWSYKKIDGVSDLSKTDPGRPRISHPLQMKGAGFVATAKTGFHRIKESKSGKFTMLPEYEDLRRFFEAKHNYVSCNEVCWIFNGKFYERFEKDFLRNFAQKHFDPTADTTMVSEFTNLVLRTNLMRPQDWEKNTERKTCFNNGVLDIDSGVFTPHDDKGATRKFLFKSCVPYDYDKSATAPLFDKFMDDVTRGVTEFKQNALEYFGYAIAGEPIWLAQTLLLLGPDGAGGKSTTLNIIKKVVGSGLYSTLSLEDLNDPQARAMLEGKYFNVFGETESSKYMQSKVWKALTTGEEVTIKNVFEKPYSIKSRAKMMFASNHVPKSNDTSDAFMRRWLVIPFTRNFLEEWCADPFIEQKLEAELPGIFNMLVDAYKRLKVRGSFEIGPESRKVLEAFKNEVDPVRGWFGDCVEDLGEKPASIDSFVSSIDLFANFQQYCRNQNMEIASRMVTGKAFSLKIQKLLVGKADRKATRTGSSGDTVRGYWGLKLRLES